VRQTLKGEYGARTTLDIASDSDSAVMYTAAPVRWVTTPNGVGNGEIIGSVTVGKPVQTFGQFVAAARSRTLYVGLLSVFAVLVLAVTVSVWLVRPFGLIADYARFVRLQQGFHPGRLLRRGWDLLRAAYDEMRDALAGRNYVADYVQTLTHEVKSPLSAIRGAAELLQEPMEEAQPTRWLWLATTTVATLGACVLWPWSATRRRRKMPPLAVAGHHRPVGTQPASRPKAPTSSSRATTPAWTSCRSNPPR
jgi:two-component system sensor histidine kinase CreC